MPVTREIALLGPTVSEDHCWKPTRTRQNGWPVDSSTSAWQSMDDGEKPKCGYTSSGVEQDSSSSESMIAWCTSPVEVSTKIVTGLEASGAREPKGRNQVFQKSSTGA